MIELASAQHPWHGIRDLYHLIQKLEQRELPDIPASLSATAQDFIKKCLVYEKENRWTAAQLLEHPFVKDAAQKKAADSTDVKEPASASLLPQKQ